MATVDEILKFLERGGFVSGQEISRALGVSRNAVSKWVRTLRERGYDIESVTNKGYRLIRQPDFISEEKITRALSTAYIGRPTVYLDEVDSTNEEIKRRARTSSGQGLVAVADRQTLGKGRLGRRWESPKGMSIYLSVLLRPELAPSQVQCLTLASGLAVCNTINALGFSSKIKWPNDVIIGNKKLCGILTEMSVEDNAVSFAVVGIGINVNNSAFPQEIESKATSLYIESGEVCERSDIIAALLKQLELVYDEFIMGGFQAIREEYASLCATIGREIKAELRGRTIIGQAVDIAEDGSLIIKTDSGLEHISTGEVAVQGIY